MDFSTLLQATELHQEREPVMITSLYVAFQGLTDPRKQQGKRYELAVVLTVLVLAKLAGETTLSAATHWVRSTSNLAGRTTSPQTSGHALSEHLSQPLSSARGARRSAKSWPPFSPALIA